VERLVHEVWEEGLAGSSQAVNCGEKGLGLLVLHCLSLSAHPCKAF
jgi:hypothetical protein